MTSTFSSDTVYLKLYLYFREDEGLFLHDCQVYYTGHSHNPVLYIRSEYIFYFSTLKKTHSFRTS